MEDHELLREYVASQSERAFAELVSRHVNLVYATARRVVGNQAAAQDVAQTVFILLARKAWTIHDGGALAGWLYRAAHRAAIDFVRRESQRRRREFVAMSLAEQNVDLTVPWEKLAPLLDEALQQLGRLDQNAVVLHYLEGRSVRETGTVLALSEAAARKRLTRAAEKMRLYFARRGVTATAALLASAMSAQGAQTAPAGLSATLAKTSVGVAAGSAGWGGTLLKTLYMSTKTKIILTAAVVLALAAIPFVIQFHESERLRAELSATQQSRDQLQARFAKLEKQAEATGRAVVGDGSTTQAKNDGRKMTIENMDEAVQEATIKNPADYLANAARIQASLAKQYADLFVHFHFSPEERAYFLKVLTDDAAPQQAFFLKMEDPNLPADERAAMEKQNRDRFGATVQVIRQFLNNDDDYAYYHQYSHMDAERERMDEVGAGLEYAGQPITPDQRDALLNIMYQERKNFSPSGNPPASSEEEQQLRERIAQKAAQVLSPEQLASFQQVQTALAAHPPTIINMSMGTMTKQ